MKKLVYLSVFLILLVSFTGCYSGRAVVVERPVRRVAVVPEPGYYYRPAPVIVEPYRYSYRRARGGHRGWRNGYNKY